MNNQILFTESQRFRQWWIWLLIIYINGFFLYGIFTQVIGEQPFGSKPMSNTGLIISSIITLLITVLFISFRLDTLIRTDGIYVRFFPFQIKFMHYEWNSLTKCYIRQYSAVREYGGWGWRMGLFGQGKAYNVSGNKGLQLVFNNNKKLLIGTSKAEQLTETLSKIGRIKL